MHLFDPVEFRGVTLRNRVAVSPMCQYCASDGLADDWHLVHLGSRAAGGAGLVIAEASAVTADGRITPGDLGIWSDEHRDRLVRVAKFIKSQNSVPGIQLAHAGRKASCAVPQDGGKQLAVGAGGWETVGPSAVQFRDADRVPRELSVAEIGEIEAAFLAATRRALEAGFEVIELHAAHGYLLHSFLSPLSNTRTDEFGGSLENRMRLLVRLAEKTRAIMPDRLPLFVRISYTDHAEGGWDLPQSVELARALKNVGVDLIDVSSGALVDYAHIKVSPEYQVPAARSIKLEANIATGAVGLITKAGEAEGIIRRGDADIVLLGREMLRDPYFALHAAKELGVEDVPWPRQYGYAVKR